MVEGRARRWRNEGREAGRGEHGVKEGVKDEGRAGRRGRNEGVEAGMGEHEVSG